VFDNAAVRVFDGSTGFYELRHFEGGCAAKGGTWYPFANPQKCFKRDCKEVDSGL